MKNSHCRNYDYDYDFRRILVQNVRPCPTSGYYHHHPSLAAAQTQHALPAAGAGDGAVAGADIRGLRGHRQTEPSGGRGKWDDGKEL